MKAHYNPTTEATPAIVKALEVWFRKKYPYVPSDEFMGLSSAEKERIAQSYKNWKRLGYIFLWVFFIVLPLLFSWLLFQLNGLLLLYFYKEVITIVQPEWLLFIISGALFTFSILGWIVDFVQRIVYGKERNAQFNEYLHALKKYDNAHIMKLAARLFAFLGVISLLFTLNTKFVICNDRILIHTITDIQDYSFAFSEVKQVGYYQSSRDKHGNESGGAFYKVRFSSGYVFGSSFYQSDAAKFREAILLISQRSGVPIKNGGIYNHYSSDNGLPENVFQ